MLSNLRHIKAFCQIFGDKNNEASFTHRFPISNHVLPLGKDGFYVGDIAPCIGDIALTIGATIIITESKKPTDFSVGFYILVN